MDEIMISLEFNFCWYFFKYSRSTTMPQDVKLMFLWFMLPVRDVLYSYLASSCKAGANFYFFFFVVFYTVREAHDLKIARSRGTRTLILEISSKQAPATQSSILSSNKNALVALGVRGIYPQQFSFHTPCHIR